MAIEIMRLMGERLEYKNEDPEKYEEVHRMIWRKIREAKQKWMADECVKKDHSFNVNKAIQEVVGQKMLGDGEYPG